MDYHSLDEKTTKIIDNIDTLNNKISVIKKKISTIVYPSINKNGVPNTNTPTPTHDWSAIIKHK